MIPKSGKLVFGKARLGHGPGIMLKQITRAGYRLNENHLALKRPDYHAEILFTSWKPGADFNEKFFSHRALEIGKAKRGHKKGRRTPDHVMRIPGLKRRGFTQEQIRSIREAYRTLYRSDLLLVDAIAQLQERVASQPEIAPFVEFITTSKRGLIR